MANQRCTGAAFPQSLGQDANVCKRGEPAGGGCGSLARERARHQVQLGLTDLAHLHFTREFAASPLFSSSYRLPPWLSSTALRPDALNTRWDRKQANNESSSPLCIGGKGEHLLSAFCVPARLHGHPIYSSHQSCDKA